MRVVRPSLIWGFIALCSATASAAAQKPTLTPAEYGRWETLGTTVLSPDGRWLAYGITRVNGDEELRIREVAADSTRVVPWATNPAFSPDGRWLAYGVGLPRAERERLQQASQPAQQKVELVDLRSGTLTVVPDIASFDFSGDSRYIALRGYTPPTSTDAGADVIVRDLTTGQQTSLQHVTTHAWQPQGALLALTVKAAQPAGSSVRVYDARAGAVRVLAADTADFAGLAWRDSSADLAVLRVQRRPGFADPTHAILVWRRVSDARPAHRVLDPLRRRDVPADRRIVSARDLQWSRDGRTIFLGTREWQHRQPVDTMQADSTAAKAEHSASVEVWHTADVDIVPQQKVRAGIDRNRSHLAAWHLDRDRYVQLGGPDLPEVTLSNGRFASGLDPRPHEQARRFGPEYRDLYAVDVQTGERTRFAERVQHQYGVSPGGRYMLYVRAGHYWTYDTQSRRHTNITKDIPTSFINLEHDFTVEEKPPFGTGGWTTGDRSVLLYDRYDVWEVSPDGARAENLTHGAAERIRHRRAWLDPTDRVVDLERGAYVIMYGTRTKRYGYARVRRGAPAERLVYLERNVSRLTRAERADVYMYRVEAFDDSPDWLVGGPGLADAKQVTNTNPFMREYAWGRAELVDFRNRTGRDLQAALLYPASYEPGRQYPMIVYIYEITSNTLHDFTVPSEYIPFNPTVFTQNGYFVLRPDIVYRARDPGVSAVDALVPAVEKVLATGMVDRARIGLIGHSWGGYQTAFAVTQTDLFRAAVAAAPLTDLVSMYASVFWSTGVPDARIFEIDQARMEVPFWEDLDAYIRNSPLFQVRDMKAPLLVAFGDRDDAVNWHQGVMLYNAARRAGKDMVLLVYEGESHSISRRANQQDFHRRTMAWFDHYLKRAPAPAWITSGVPAQGR